MPARRALAGALLLAAVGCAHAGAYDVCESGEAIELPGTIGTLCPYQDVQNPWIDVLRNRTETSEALLHQISGGKPVHNTLGIHDLTGPPLGPASLNGDPTPLELSWHVQSIKAIDQKRQQFEFHVTMRWVWTDCRLVSRCHLLTISYKHARFKSFWAPAYKIYEVDRAMTDGETKAMRHMFFGAGWDIYQADEVMLCTCSFDFREMPWDEQVCNLSISLPSRTAFGQGGTLLHWGKITSDHLDQAEWTIEQGPAWRTFEGTRVGTMDVVESQLVAQFTFRRKPAYMIRTVVVQVLLTYGVSWAGLWVQLAAVPARAFMAVIPVLVLMGKMNSVSESTPPIPYDTRLSIFLMCTLAFVCFHALEFAFAEFAGIRAAQLKERAAAYQMINQRERAPTAETIGAAQDREAQAGVATVSDEKAEGTASAAERAAGPPRRLELELAVMEAVHRHLEQYLRFISPLGYILCVVITFNA